MSAPSGGLVSDESTTNSPCSNVMTSLFFLRLLEYAPFPVFHRRVVAADLRSYVVDEAEEVIPLLREKRTIPEGLTGCRVTPDPPEVIDHGREILPPLPTPPVEIGRFGMEMATEQPATAPTTAAVMGVVPQQMEQTDETVVNLASHGVPPYDPGQT